MWLLGCSRSCHGVAIRLLECSGWLLGHCYVVANVFYIEVAGIFWGVARVLLCGF